MEERRFYVCITVCIRYDGLIIDAARECIYKRTDIQRDSRTIRDVHSYVL